MILTLWTASMTARQEVRFQTSAFWTVDHHLTAGWMSDRIGSQLEREAGSQKQVRHRQNDLKSFPVSIYDTGQFHYSGVNHSIMNHKSTELESVHKAVNHFLSIHPGGLGKMGIHHRCCRTGMTKI